MWSGIYHDHASVGATKNSAVKGVVGFLEDMVFWRAPNWEPSTLSRTICSFFLSNLKKQSEWGESPHFRKSSHFWSSDMPQSNQPYFEGDPSTGYHHSQTWVLNRSRLSHILSLLVIEVSHLTYSQVIYYIIAALLTISFRGHWPRVWMIYMNK